MRTVIFALGSMLAATSALAQSEQVKRGPAPAWAIPSEMLAVPADVSGPIFMRRQDMLVHLDKSGQAQYFSYRARILHPNALQLGNLTIGWNPATGSATVHAIKVYRDNAVIDVLEKSSFEILRREDQLEASKLDGNLTAVLRVPDLRVGDELEVSLTTVSRDPTIGDSNAGILALGPAPAPGRYRLALSWADRAPTLKATADMTAAMRKEQRGIEFRFDNPALLAPPKDAPARFQWQRAIEYSDFADWAAVSRHFAPLFAKAAQLPGNSPIKAEARRIMAAHPKPLDRAAAALKLVQQDVRYIYVGLNGGNLKPATAEETWQRRFGDCKGKTALLLALLAELSIAAEPVLIQSTGADDGLDERLPLPQMFDHVLVRAQIDGASLWLDGTLPPVVPPGSAPAFPARWVLPLTLSGGSIEKLPWTPPTTPDEVHLYEIDARAGFDKPARITSTSIVRGVGGLQQQAQFSALAPAQLLDGFRQELTGNTWQAIDDVKWRYDEKAAASVLTIVGTGAVDWSEEDAGGKSLALPGGGFSPPERRLRAANQNQDAPFYTKPEFECRVTTVRLPAAAQTKGWTAKPSYDMRYFGRAYHRAFELRDGAVRMIRASRVEQPEIDAATARRDNGRIAAFDASMAWITYDPAGRTSTVGKGETVPATYELDWTADDVPCRSDAKPR